MENIEFFRGFSLEEYFNKRLKEKSILKRDFYSFIGVNPSSFTEMLNNVSNFRIRYIEKIAEILDLDFDELLSIILKVRKIQKLK